MNELLHNGLENGKAELAPDEDDTVVLATKGLKRVIGSGDWSEKDAEKRDEGGDNGERDEESEDEEKENGGEEGEREDGEEDREGEDDGYGEYYYGGDYDEYGSYDLHEGNERLEVKEDGLRIEAISLPQEIWERYDFLKELPEGVAVMGGVARSIAREVITGDREPIRDIDLVNIVDEAGNSKVDGDTLERLGRKLMPDDYAFGHGVGNDTLEHYFASRDFTVNQSLVLDGKLLVSDVAYDDFQENIIRPTYYELPYDGDSLSSRLFLKAVMMRSVLSQVTESIPLLEDIDAAPDYIGSFDLALFLNKAMSRGAETACIFTEDLADWGVIAEEYADRPKAMAKRLLDEVYSFEFRPSTDPHFMDTVGTDDLEGFFIPEAMAEYYDGDPKIRAAMAEYEDGGPLTLDFGSGRERTSGHYSQADYDEINASAGY